MNQNKIIIAEFVKFLRFKNNLSIEDIALKLEISKLRYILFEKGFFLVDFDFFDKICLLFNIDIRELVNGLFGLSVSDRNHATLVVLDYYRYCKKINIIGIILFLFAISHVILIAVFILIKSL